MENTTPLISTNKKQIVGLIITAIISVSLGVLLGYFIFNDDTDEVVYTQEDKVEQVTLEATIVPSIAIIENTVKTIDFDFRFEAPWLPAETSLPIIFGKIDPGYTTNKSTDSNIYTISDNDFELQLSLGIESEGTSYGNYTSVDNSIIKDLMRYNISKDFTLDHNPNEYVYSVKNDRFQPIGTCEIFDQSYDTDCGDAFIVLPNTNGSAKTIVIAICKVQNDAGIEKCDETMRTVNVRLK